MADKTYRHLLWAGVAALIVFAPAARGAVRIWAMAPILIVEFFLVFLWAVRGNGPRALIATPIDLPVALFVFLAAVSCLRSAYAHDSLYAFAGLLGYTGIYYLIVNEFDRGMRKALVLVAVSTGAALSAYGLLQYIGLLPHPWWYPQEFLSSTYVNHNHFAGFLELTIPAAIGVAVYKRKIWIATVAAVMMAAFLMTQSRGGWMCLGAGLCVMFAVILQNENNSRKNAAVALISVIMLISLVVLVYFGKEVVSRRIETITGASGQEVSSDTRLKIWRGSADIIAHNPIIGTGIGTFIWAFPRYRPTGLDLQANSAHNDYLHMASEMGVLAPVIMIWIFAIVIGTGLRKGMSDPVILGLAIGFLSLCMHGLVDFNFHIPANMILFTVWAAVIMRRQDA